MLSFSLLLVHQPLSLLCVLLFMVSYSPFCQQWSSICILFCYFVTSRFMLPTFMNIFIIYSFCNVHDVTWGTRDSNLINNEAAQHNMEVSYKRFRSKLVIFWLAGNFIYAGGILMVREMDMYKSSSMLLLCMESFLPSSLVFSLDIVLLDPFSIKWSNWVSTSRSITPNLEEEDCSRQLLQILHTRKRNSRLAWWNEV